jgi:hypothetical protein
LPPSSTLWDPEQLPAGPTLLAMRAFLNVTVGPVVAPSAHAEEPTPPGPIPASLCASVTWVSVIMPAFQIAPPPPNEELASGA